MNPPGVGSPVLWAGFTVFVLVMVVLDLVVFHRKAHEVSLRESLIWTAVWIGLIALDRLQSGQHPNCFASKSLWGMNQKMVDRAVIVGILRQPKGVAVAVAVLHVVAGEFTRQ